jgi:hypothetical protein
VWDWPAAISFFGSHDWYREGAAELIRRLCKWDESSRSFSIYENTGGDGRRAKIKTDDLAFALLFLSRGRVPVAIQQAGVRRQLEQSSARCRQSHQLDS